MLTTFQTVNVVEPTDGFNSLVTVTKAPIIELKSNYGLSVFRDIQTVTGTGAISNDSVEYLVKTGTNTASTARLSSSSRGRYIPGQASEVGIGIRLDHTFSGTQNAMWGYFDADNGFGFGKDATGLFVFVRRAGTDTKIYSGNWNGDSTSIDLSEGNIFQIKFSWYGYGTINFEIIKDLNNKQTVTTLHRFNPTQQTSVEDPNLPISAYIDNGDTTENIDLYVGGRQYSILGSYNPNFRISSDYRLSQGSIGETFLPTISFKQKTSFKSASVQLNGLEIITDSDLVFQMRLGATLTGASFSTPSNTTASETAIETDTSATAISGGNLIYSGLIKSTGAGGNTGGEDTVRSLRLDIPEGLIVSLAVRKISGTGGTVSSVLLVREEW